MNAAYAVLDLERSGFCAATDAILEIAVVHWSPGDQPQLREDVPEHQARAVHASVLATLLAGCAINGRVDDDEAETIDHAMRILGLLGWAPGQEPASGRRKRDA